jgi:hypothetical protein
MRQRLALFLLLALLGASPAVHACMCPATNLQRRLTHSTAVFVARIEAIDSRQDQARLRILKPIKGRYTADQVVTMRADTGTSCMAPIAVEAEVLVFLDEFANPEPGINGCNAFLLTPVQHPNVRWEPDPKALEFLRTTVEAYMTRQQELRRQPPPR